MTWWGGLLIMTDGEVSAALNELWADLSRRPLWRRPYTWLYIKLMTKYRLKLLSPKDVKILVPRGKVNYCHECCDNCCLGKHSAVLLHLQDIAMLLDKGHESYISQEKPTFAKEVLNERPALERNQRSVYWRVFPIIKQNKFHACSALGVDGLCKLYPNWPLSCARFPYSLHADDKRIFFSPRCPSYLLDEVRGARAAVMIKAAVEAYNAQIKDIILLHYVPEKLSELGLMKYLKWPL